MSFQMDWGTTNIIMANVERTKMSQMDYSNRPAHRPTN